MPEPDNFSPTEQFQDVNKRIWNRLVREYFRDINLPENNLDLTTPRQALLKACLHKDEDSLLLTIGRMQLFLFGTTFLRDQYPIVAGELLSEIDAKIVYRPRITLYFREDAEDAEPGYSPVEMQTSWRLINETSQTLTESELRRIGTQIKAKFGAGRGYVFRKGRKIVKYLQKEQGYNFLLRARDAQEGKDLIREVLSINGHSLDNQRLVVSEVDNEGDAFPYNPGFQIILGKRKQKPRRRPLVNVRFRYAYATLYGYNKPVYLYAKNAFVSDALVD